MFDQIDTINGNFMWSSNWNQWVCIDCGLSDRKSEVLHLYEFFKYLIR